MYVLPTDTLQYQAKPTCPGWDWVGLGWAGLAWLALWLAWLASWLAWLAWLAALGCSLVGER
jgi:hypothetical protein